MAHLASFGILLVIGVICRTFALQNSIIFPGSTRSSVTKFEDRNGVSLKLLV